MSYLVVEPHLIELVRTMDAQGFVLTVAGGLGLYLKRRWVEQQVLEHTRMNLIAAVPQARPTVDIDVFLSMDVFLAPPETGVTRFRAALETLGYRVLPTASHFQFAKTVGNRTIKLDLHARLPRPAEPGLKYKHPRVGRSNQPPQPLHAYGTPEAFAIEERPRRVPLLAPDGGPFAGEVQVPHPFAALCMKIKAALDHERSPPEMRKPVNQKHAFDVYLLLAMLDREESDELRSMVQTFADHPELLVIQTAVTELFGAAGAPGCRTIEVQGRDLGEPVLDLARFSALLGEHFIA